mgnify:CR=1 FL=1
MIPEQEARERTKKEAARAKASPRLVAEVVAGIANTRSMCRTDEVKVHEIVVDAGFRV